MYVNIGEIPNKNEVLSTLKVNNCGINCRRCGYCGKTAFTKRGAVKKWNNDKGRAK